MPKVLHVITGLLAGGAETMLLKLLSGTHRDRFAPTVVSLTDRGVLGARIEALGVSVYTLEMAPGVPSPLGLWRLVKLARELQPDLVQAWMYHGNLAAQLSAPFVRPRAPVLWNIRGDHTLLSAEPPLTALVIWMCARMSRLPVRIVANSRKSLVSHQGILGYSRQNWCVVPNGFDTDLFVPSDGARKRLREELGIAPGTLLVANVGRYHPVKNHALFLDAAAILLGRHPESHFLLVGDGMDGTNRELVTMIEQRRLQGVVHLLGRREDIAGITAGIDIATSSSRSEGFSNALGEAMSCGVPCVATDVGDSAWLVGDTGLLVPPGDTESFAGALSELVARGPEGRRDLGRAARQRIIEKFSLSSVIEQYEQIYEDVLNGAKERAS